MSGEENPASKPTPVQDIQGDGRWMSLVSDPARDHQESGVGAGAREFSWLARLSRRDWETEGSGAVLSDGPRERACRNSPVFVPEAP